MQFLRDQQEKADAKELQRQQDIASGTQSIDAAYSGYNQNYYDGIAQDYTQNYANPQIKLQQGKDLQQAKFGLARNGISNSSAAAKEIGDINTIYGQAATDAANRGQQIAQDRQGQVNSARNTALQQLQQAEQPGTTLANAVRGADAYKISPAAVAVTDLLTNAANSVNRAYMTNAYFGNGQTSFFGGQKQSTGGQGTAKVVQ